MSKLYKVFKPDWQCKGVDYRVYKTYISDSVGFGVCESIVDCFNYYKFDPKNKIAIVSTDGRVQKINNKTTVHKITILKEITWKEALDIEQCESRNSGLSNTGGNNSGDYNTGDNNKGDFNTGNNNIGSFNTGSNNLGADNVGNYNIGNYNIGKSNIGNYNVGNYNTGHNNIRNYNTGNLNYGYNNIGDCNTGNSNTGHNNSGNFNTGDYNSGDFNSGNYSTGVFCTKTTTATIKMFDKDSKMTLEDWKAHPIGKILSNLKLTEWINDKTTSEDEKDKCSKARIAKGHLIQYTYKEAWANLWKILTENEKNQFKELPNFDSEIFEEITGIKLK